MSLGTWMILFNKFMEQSRLFNNAKKTRQQFWNQLDIDKAIERLDHDSAFHYVAEIAIKAQE
jgi:biopolymer transport protein ExbB/TolQ